MAADTSDWLANVYVPPGPTALGGSTPADDLLQLERASCLAAMLQKSARRRRSGEDFVCCVERELAQWFGAKWEAVAVTGGVLAADNDAGVIGVPFNVQRAMQRFRTAAKARRGRKSLSLRQMELRESGELRHLDERHRKRLQRRARHERALEEWHRRGNTLMGGNEPYPKF